MDRILFGDNQFFGVNHMSEEKARAQAMRFKDTDAIMRVLDSAHDLGVRTFMCTTHDRVGVPELHGLGARLLLGHVVHAEELVVAKEDAVHR